MKFTTATSMPSWEVPEIMPRMRIGPILACGQQAIRAARLRGCAHWPGEPTELRRYAPDMHRAARLSAILERLADGGSVAVADLAGDLGASAATIRRDLVILENQRLLARTHGGAVAHAVSYELPLRTRASGTPTRSGASPSRRRST